jgi:hypothetical protein
MHLSRKGPTVAASVRKARTGHPRTGQGRAERKRRKIILTVTAATMALGGAAVVVPSAIAEEEAVTRVLDETAEILPVSDEVLGLVNVGEVAELSGSLLYSDDAEVLEVSDPDAGYVKVHFERLLLNSGDFVTVSSPDGSESYRYEESLIDQWATSITGDTAIVELHRATDGVDSTALGALIDKAAYGFAPDVVDDLAEERADQARPEESLCEGDEKRPSACYRGSNPEVVEHAEPVARLLIDGTVLCTAFRVGESNRLLTNHHCFTESWEAQATEVWFGYDCTACGVDIANAPVKVHGSEVLATSKSLDYTLFSVDGFERVKRFGHLELAEEPAKRDDPIYIPQHPAGRPSEIAMESSVDGGNCVVKNATYDGYVVGSDISYYCDTEFGSSGSPVLSRDTHEVVALHHFGGCPNSGVKIQLIADEIGHLL